MLHAKFQDHRTSGSGEDFKGLYHIRAWRPSWSRDQHDLYKINVPSSHGGSKQNLALIG